MAPFVYTPLPTDTSHLNLRLIKLQPSNDRSAQIRCKIIDYPLVPDRSVSHLYECLSYVWGTSEDPSVIKIETAQNTFDFEVTQNLYAALIQLRDPFFERILWVDAVCINQDDDREKTHQVAAMARIYGLASRVVAWLGEEADESALAFQELKSIAQHQQPQHQLVELADKAWHEAPPIDNVETNLSESINNNHARGILAVDAVLNRAYFRRMWILQEVTAARSVVYKCGQAEMQSSTFISGVEGLSRPTDWELRNRIGAFTMILKLSAYRENVKGQAHLNIDTLLHLVQRFHTYEATDLRDKIYALWGLSSDSKMMRNLQPDYGKPWKDLFEELGRTMFGAEAFSLAAPGSQTMLVRSISCALGKVRFSSHPDAWATEQTLAIESMRVSVQLGEKYNWNQDITIKALTGNIQEDDIAFFIPLVRRLVIARPCNCYFRVLSV
ncbi:HET-domain-containing protein, partial [Periconia macrospinosa]